MLVNRSGAQLGLFDYSLTEQWTGKRWIDGKKIYVKSINFGALPNNTQKESSLNIPGISKILDVNGFAYNASNPDYFMILPYPHPTPSESVSIYATIKKGVVGIRTGENRTEYNTTFINVYYTKNE